MIKLGTNIPSLMANRRLAEASNEVSTVFERLSSGMRINRASDDAAGLAIASALNADSRIYSQAIRNVNDGISVLNIAQGALNQLSEITTRQMELAEQAANGVYSGVQRKALMTEANSLVAEFNRIVQSVEFNGNNLLDGSVDDLRIQAGYGVQGGISFGITESLSRSVGDGTFRDQIVSNPVAAAAGHIREGDFNGDGVSDLAIDGYLTSSGISILIGRGDGTFETAVTYQAAVNSFVMSLGDFNNDGITDIISSDGATVSSILLGNGNGTFRARQTFATAPSIFDLTTGDMNGDGYDDIIMANYAGAGSINVFLSRGDGTFHAAQSYASGGKTKRVEIGDVNGDGRMDILSSNYGADNLTVLLNSGSGFTTSATLAVGDRPRSATFADLNLDGYLDIVNIDQTAGGVNVFLGRGDGTFGNRVTYASFTLGQVRMEVEDLNGDGVFDLAINNTGADRLGVMIGNSDGSFRAITTYLTANNPASFTIGDFNSDGALDLVAIERNATQLSLHLANPINITTSPFLHMGSPTEARESLDILRATLGRISSEMGGIGATQSRLEVALNTLTVARENFDAAASRIIDADVAQESANLVRLNILQQAAASVLAQANQGPALALTLLRV